MTVESTPVRTTFARGRGFTLVELLVVVSIIAVLMAILLPTFKQARAQAKKVTCFANLKSTFLALSCYADDNKQELPSYDTMGGWGFRVAPGKVKKVGTTGGYPEAYGVQAVLHTGTSTRTQQNGLPEYRHHNKPVYMPGDSKTWICPANIGPKDRAGEWPRLGNTYYYRTVTPRGTSDEIDPDTGKPIVVSPEDAHRASMAYNLDWLARTRSERNRIIVSDNYAWEYASSGMGRPANTGQWQIKLDLRQPPHILKTHGKPVMSMWAAVYPSGAVDIHVLKIKY